MCWRKSEGGRVAFPTEVVTAGLTATGRLVWMHGGGWRHVEGVGRRGHGEVQDSGKQQKGSGGLSRCTGQCENDWANTRLKSWATSVVPPDDTEPT